MAAPVVAPTWDPNDRKYKCCCNRYHVKTGSRIVLIDGSVNIGLFLFELVFQLIKKPGFYYMTGCNVAWIVSGTVGLVFLLLGLKYERPKCLMPYMVFLLVSPTPLLVYSVLLGAVPSFRRSLMKYVPFGLDGIWKGSDINKRAIVFAVVYAVAWLLWALLSIWFFLVLLRCYRYFNDKKLYDKYAGQPTDNTGIEPQAGGELSPDVQQAQEKQ